MRLEKIQEYIKQKEWPYQFHEDDDLGSIDLDYRGVSYHIWEFCEDGYGVESNVEHGGSMVEYTGDYEEQIIEALKKWD